jgi:phage protein D/phage baseplate assembly protein gpV
MTSRAQFPFVGIDGTAIRDDLRREIVEAFVDDHLVLPDSFMIRFRFDDPGMWGNLRARIGQEVEIRAGGLGESADSTLIKAEITSIEALFEHGNRYLVIKGYDASHRLQSGRKTRSFNNVSDSDLAQRIASDAGLRVGTIESTSTVHDHVSQINTTDWDFLRTRAQEIGYKVGVRDGQFSFESAAGSGGGGPGGGVELTVGDSLLMFRPRVTGAQQVSQVEARGWDMSRKEAVTHEASAETSSVTLNETGWTPSDLAQTFGSPSYLTCELPIATDAEARSVAEATVAGIASSFAEAEGTAEGNPRLVTGGTVTISGSGPFDGEYLVSHSRHRFDQDGYHTDFEVAGDQERSLLGLTTMGATGQGAPPIYGAVVALVTNTQDPENLGRVKLKFPWLSEDYESYWARVAYPGAGPERGFMVVPEVDDEVLVIFARGDMRQPFVLGGLYNGVDAPPSTDYVDGSDGAVKVRRWKSTSGHMISLDDNSDKEAVVLSSGDEAHTITISQSDGEITIKTDGKIVLEAQQDLELKGVNIKIAADSSLELTGANTKLEGAGQTEVKGGIVMIN